MHLKDEMPMNIAERDTYREYIIDLMERFAFQSKEMIGTEKPGGMEIGLRYAVLIFTLKTMLDAFEDDELEQRFTEVYEVLEKGSKASVELRGEDWNPDLSADMTPEDAAISFNIICAREIRAVIDAFAIKSIQNAG